MIAITWQLYNKVQYLKQWPSTAPGSNISNIVSDFLWKTWNGDGSTADIVFEYDFSLGVEINNLLIYNHNFALNSEVELQLKNHDNQIIYTNSWKIGTLDVGFSEGGFGITGFGGYKPSDFEINPYSLFSRIFETKLARYATVTIKNVLHPASIGFLSLGKSFVPLECDISRLNVQYETAGTQVRAVGGTVNGKTASNTRRVSLTMKMFNYSDFKEVVQMIVNRNTANMMFFTVSAAVDDEDEDLEESVKLATRL